MRDTSSARCSDGTKLRDVTPERMTAAQRAVYRQMNALPTHERLEFVRFVSAEPMTDRVVGK